MENKAQKVKLAVQISGDYVAWHEISISLLWDYTNDKKLGYDSKEEVDEKVDEDGEYSDCEIREGVLVNGKYYIQV